MSYQYFGTALLNPELQTDQRACPPHFGRVYKVFSALYINAKLHTLHSALSWHFLVWSCHCSSLNFVWFFLKYHTYSHLCNFVPEFLFVGIYIQGLWLTFSYKAVIHKPISKLEIGIWYLHRLQGWLMTFWSILSLQSFAHKGILWVLLWTSLK